MALRATSSIVLVALAVLGLHPSARAGAAKSGGAPDPDTQASVRAVSVDDRREQVRKTEVGFAKTMADRDHAGFVKFLDPEAIFVGPRRTFRGRQAVADGWKPLFEGAKAPFSWAPEKVEIVESGTLALSSGPVLDPEGKRIGTFNSTWRQKSDGSWKIVLDIGCPDCDCGKKN